VAECVSSDEEQVLRDIGAAAANYLETTIKPNEVIGISSWSESLLAMVDAMHPVSTRSSARVVQILGGVGTPAAEVHATRLTERLASLVGGEELMLPAPGVVGSTASRQVFLEDPFVSEVMAKFKSISLALVGIGAISPAQLIEASGNTFSPEELIVLEESGAVGDICLRFFDATGAPVITSLDERVIGITLEELRRVRRCVGIAGGPRKLAAIESALQGRLVNVLITDRFTAEALI
jgi:DNA-binding transcriptional regulator LsrR (DeoR family)